MMKHSFLTRLPFVMAAIFSLLLFAETISFAQAPQVILISHTSGDLPDAPRSPSITSIDAYYDYSSSSVCVYLINAGTTVSVEFVNLTTNETANYQIPGSGSSVLPISGNTGYWTVTFTLESGDEYSGEFIL